MLQRHLTRVCKTKRNRRFVQVGFHPLPPDTDRGRGEEKGGRAHPLGRKAVLLHPDVLRGITVWASQGQADVTGTKGASTDFGQ